jgi:hypothetical protein
MGRTGVFAAITSQTVSISFVASASKQSETINLTSKYGFLTSRGCDVAFYASSLDSNNCSSGASSQSRSITKNFYVSTDSGGINESLGSINPYYDNLQLGTLSNP